MTGSDSPSNDPADAIAAALARMRGRRGPRPWGDGGPGRPVGPDGPSFRRHGPWDGHHPRERGDTRAHGDARAPGDAHSSDTPAGPDVRGRAGWTEAAQARFAGPARLRLLEALAAASTPLAVSEIGTAIGVDQPRASRLVQQCVDLDLVRREADPDDARRTRIVITEAGAAVVKGFRGERRGTVDAALADFSDQERADLARLLTKFAEAWPQT